MTNIYFTSQLNVQVSYNHCFQQLQFLAESYSCVSEVLTSIKNMTFFLFLGIILYVSVFFFFLFIGISYLAILLFNLIANVIKILNLI